MACIYEYVICYTEYKKVNKSDFHILPEDETRPEVKEALEIIIEAGYSVPSWFEQTVLYKECAKKILETFIDITTNEFVNGGDNGEH